MSFGWKLLEYLPKHARLREWPERRIFPKHHLPRGEPRLIEPDADIADSVVERSRDPSANYAPVNLPPIEPSDPAR